MEHRFGRVAIIGVGLLGGSLGVALKSRGLAKHVAGVGRRPESLDVALRVGAIDEASLDVSGPVRAADLVVICTPAASVADYLDRVRPDCSLRAVITDVASTKAEIARHVRAGSWPRPYRVVGSHPMAGSEQFGPEHAAPNLFEGAVVFVEHGDDVDPDARAIVVDLWKAVGAIVVDVDPERHDASVARTSHAPHIAAAALAQLAGSNPDIAPFIGNGFRDTTRIAEGRPEVWRDICLTNRAAILAALKDYSTRLEAFESALEASDGARLEALFADGRDARQKAMGV